MLRAANKQIRAGHLAGIDAGEVDIPGRCLLNLKTPGIREDDLIL